MPVYWESQELRPAPLVNIQKNYVRNAAGSIDHTDYIFILTGTIVNVGTSQDSPSATTDDMNGILVEQARIRQMFTDGGRLQLVSPPAGPESIEAYCTIDSISFPQGTWFNRCDYTIVLRARNILNDTALNSDLDSFDENWSITENEDGTYSVSHSLQAKGALVYDSAGVPNDPMDSAKQWITDRLYTLQPDGSYTPGTASTFDINTLITGIGSGLNGFWNKAIVEQASPTTNTWSATENFIYYPSGNYREEWTASVNFDANQLNKATVVVAGLVAGFSNPASNQAARLTNAKNQFLNQTAPNITTRVLPFVPTGFVINPVPTTKQYSYEPPGNVRYSYSFLASENGATLIPNSVEESVDINDNAASDVFAQFVIPGRANGPYFQNIHTKNSPTRTVTISATLAPSGTGYTTGTILAAYLSKPNTDAIVDALKPNTGYYYITSDGESWSPIKRVYSRSVSWTLDPQGGVVTGLPNPIHNLPA
jgi:hypothetical protein